MEDSLEELVYKNVKIVEILLAHPEYRTGLNPAADYFFSHENFNKTFELLRTEKDISSIVDYYKKSPYFVLVSTSPIKSLTRYEDNYYDTIASNSLLRDGTHVSVIKSEKVDFSIFNKLAVDYLTDSVEDKEDLSLGERILIRDIALKEFRRMVKLSQQEGFEYSINDCADVDVNESAIRQMQEYGFKLKHMNKFLDVKLSI